MTAPEPADQTRADAVSTDPDGDRARHDAWLADQTRADVVLSEAERETLAEAYANNREVEWVERILADRLAAEHAAEVEAWKKATGEVDAEHARASMDDLAEMADSARATVERVRDALDCPHGTHIYDTDATCRWCGLPSWVGALIRVALDGER